MAFKGIVTRKDKDTGVTLLAKIVTENKKKSVKQQYKVRIMANGLSDSEACSRDLVDKKNDFMSKNVYDLIQDLNFSPNGKYGTSIKYEIIDDEEESPLSDYLSDNGVVMGSPIFGNKDASGRIQITVTKGNATISGYVAVTIKAFTADRIFNDSSLVSSDLLWKIITSDPKYFLKNNKINLIKTWEPWAGMPNKPSKTPIKIEWTIEDKLSTQLGGPRITSTEGPQVITNPDYTKLMKFKTDGTAYSLGVTIQDTPIISSGSEYAKQLKFDGLTLKASLSLGEKKIDLPAYSITTLSKELDNIEVMNELKDGEKYLKTLSTGAKESNILRLYNNSTGTDLCGYIMTGTAAPTHTNVQVTRIQGLKENETYSIGAISGNSLRNRIELPDLGIAQGKLNCIVTRPEIKSFNGESNYTSVISGGESVFDVTQTNSSTGDYIVAVNLKKMKELIDSGQTDAGKFMIEQQLTCRDYGSTTTLRSTKITRQFSFEDIKKAEEMSSTG